MSSWVYTLAGAAGVSLGMGFMILWPWLSSTSMAQATLRRRDAERERVTEEVKEALADRGPRSIFPIFPVNYEPYDRALRIAGVSRTARQNASSAALRRRNYAGRMRSWSDSFIEQSVERREREALEREWSRLYAESGL